MKIPSVISFLLFCFLLPFFSASQEPRLILPIGHTLGVGSAVFSPNGKRMVTSALDNTAKIWDVESGQLLANLSGHTDTLYCSAFSPDGKKIVTTSEDGTVKIWDANSTLLLADLNGNCGKISTAEFSPDGKKIAVICENATVKLWEVSSAKLITSLTGHSGVITDFSFSLDGKTIITGSDDHTAKIWDAQSGKLLVDLKGHDLAVWSAEFCPDGKRVITASSDSTVKIWDAVTGAILKDLRGHNAPVLICHFSPDGTRFISGSDEGDVKLWNTATGTIISNIMGIERSDKSRRSYIDNICTAIFSPDGKMILTVYNMDSSAKIWDANSGVLLRDIKRNREYVNNVGVSHDGAKFALALAGGHIEIYDIAKGELLTDLKGGANLVRHFRYSLNGKRILVSNRYGSAKLLDAETGALVATFPGDEDSKSGVSAQYSPDGRRVLTSSQGNKVKLFDPATGSLLMTLKATNESINGAEFSPDGKKIYTTSAFSTKIWDATTGTLLIDLNKRELDFINYRLSPDGKKMITISLRDSISKVLDTENGNLLAELKGHKKPVQHTIFSSSGEKILTTSRDGTAKIWDTQTGIMAVNIPELGLGIRDCFFSPDGKRIIIVVQDIKTRIATAKIFTTETGNFIAELNLPGTSIQWTVFYSPDGKKILGAMENGSIVSWDAESGAFLSELKGLSGQVYLFERCLSPDGKKIVAGGYDGIAKVWNAETGELLSELKEHTFWIQAAIFSPDSKKIITVSLDHTAKVWDAESGKSLYTFISVGENDYLVLDKYNHFDGTEGARKLLYFTCGTELIELEQVKDQLWVPNLAERILNGETINAAKLSDLNICNLTPVVETIEQTALQYRFQVIPRLGGLGPTIVYVNGIEVKRYTPQQLVKQQEGYQLTINKNELQSLFVTGKENNIVVKALTAKNSISSRSVSIQEKGKETFTVLPNLYAVLVGVSDYKGEELDLKFAAKDAVDISNAIDASARKLLNADGKNHVFIHRINTGAGRDQFPEKNSIKKVFAEIAAKAQPNDILLVFFAGHGVMDAEKNQFYFLTADASSNTVWGALKEVGISTDELTEWIKPQVLKAQKRILIFDACNSGQAIKEMISIGQKGQNFIASRGDDKGKQAKAVERLNERSGLFILSASASDQKAYEMGKYNQGALTYSLLKAIKEEPGILEDRKYLNISRWFNAAEKSVNELARESGAKQQPQIVSTTNFNIGVVDDEVRNTILLPFEKPLFTRSDFRNTGSRIDNLKLRALVDKQLAELSENNSAATILYSPEYDGANVYAISGDYTVTGNEISVSLLLTKGGTEIQTRLEIRELTANLDLLSRRIAGDVMNWLKNH